MTDDEKRFRDQYMGDWSGPYREKVESMKRIVHSQTSATKSWGAACVRLLGAISGNEQSPYLTDGDRGFVRDMREKAQAYGSGFVASESQVRRLEDLRDRLKEK